jgi:carboxypeptidase family protein/TonB-dependent receptor-like protein
MRQRVVCKTEMEICGAMGGNMFQRRFRVVAGLVAAAVIIITTATPAFGQIQTGSLLVRAVDEQGAVIPGASVTITSPVMPRGIAGTTDTDGVYQVPGLNVGRYAIRVTLSGFQTVVREEVVVRQGQTATVEIGMKVSSLSEEVTVKGESPVVDTRSANVNVSLDKNLLENTPGGKDIWNILEYKVPGLDFAVPDVGGNQAGLQRAFTARGTPNAQNVQLLNGVNVGDPAAIGFSMNYYDPSSFDNILVSSGAQDISVGTSGVVINMVTKSGTNRFSGQVLQTYQGEKTQTDNIDEALKQAGFRPNANAVDYITNTNVQAGGPLLRNKLFYFGSFNHQPTHVNVPGFPAVSPVPVLLGDTSDQDTTDITTGTGRLTYQLAAHKFDFYGSRQRYDKPNRGASATVTQDSASKEYDFDNVLQGLWSWVLTDRLFANTNISFNNVDFPLYQKTTQQPLEDIAPNPTIQLRNRTSSAIMERRRLEVQSNWQYYVPQFLRGRHEIKGGFNNSYTPEDVTTERVDDVNVRYRSFATSATSLAGPVDVTIFNSPFTVKRAVMNTAFYAQDTYSIGRLTAIAGLRWERVEGFIPEQTRPSSRYFPTGMVVGGLNVALNTGGVLTQYTVPDRFSEVHNAPLWTNWAPRFAGTYDLTGDGKTLVKVSWGKYLDQIGTGTPGPNPNGAVSQRYTWLDLNGDLAFQAGNAAWDGTKYVGGEFGPLAAGTTTVPNPNRFDPRDRTYRNEITAGIDREVFPGVRGSVTYIRKREHDPTGTIFVPVADWASAFIPLPVIDPGIDGRTGTADDATITGYSLLPIAATNQRVVNDDRLAARYDGIEMTAEKRYERGFALVAGYTFGKTRVDQTSLASPNALINSAGETANRRHLLKLTGSYMLPYQILFGANMRWQSGLPFARSITVNSCSATVTTNCLTPTPGSNNTTILVEPRGSRTLPALTTVDVRAGRFFRFGTNRLELSMDLYNLTNSNTIYDVRMGSGLTSIRVAGDPTVPSTQIQTFLSPTGVLGPRIIRFNVTYQFGLR